jgi:hypothetical protein
MAKAENLHHLSQTIQPVDRHQLPSDQRHHFTPKLTGWTAINVVQRKPLLQSSIPFAKIRRDSAQFIATDFVTCCD